MNTDYDVIVAGGGLTGTVAAQAISHYYKRKFIHSFKKGNARTFDINRKSGL